MRLPHCDKYLGGLPLVILVLVPVGVEYQAVALVRPVYLLGRCLFEQCVNCLQISQ